MEGQLDRIVSDVCDSLCDRRVDGAAIEGRLNVARRLLATIDRNSERLTLAVQNVVASSADATEPEDDSVFFQ